MRLPNKVTPYNDSVLSIFSLLLVEIKKRSISPVTLFGRVKNEVNGITNFLIALDCLFALNKIKLDKNDDQSEFLVYVD